METTKSIYSYIVEAKKMSLDDILNKYDFSEKEKKTLSTVLNKYDLENYSVYTDSDIKGLGKYKDEWELNDSDNYTKKEELLSGEDYAITLYTGKDFAYLDCTEFNIVFIKKDSEILKVKPEVKLSNITSKFIEKWSNPCNFEKSKQQQQCNDIITNWINKYNIDENDLVLVYGIDDRKLGAYDKHLCGKVYAKTYDIKDNKEHDYDHKKFIDLVLKLHFGVLTKVNDKWWFAGYMVSDDGILLSELKQDNSLGCWNRLILTTKDKI